MSIIDHPKRLVLEHCAMRERWGNSGKLCSNKSRTNVWWEYIVKMEGNAFSIKIEYPSDYPASPPDIYVKTTLPSETPHLLSGKRMCWFYPGSKSNKNRWNPARDTAAVAVGVAHRWLMAFLIWDATGKWPVPDAVNN